MKILLPPDSQESKEPAVCTQTEEEEHEEAAFLFKLTTMLRVLALIIVLAFVGIPILLFTTDPPPWLKLAVLRLLQVHPDLIHPAAKISISALSYHFHSSTSFKLALLCLFVISLVFIGGLSLFVTGEESLYSAFW